MTGIREKRERVRERAKKRLRTDENQVQCDTQTNARLKSFGT
jgi:hypothetical protein